MMMWTLSAPPSGSEIVAERQLDHTALSWPNPKGGFARYLMALFILFWLGGWGWGLVAVTGTLLSPDSKAPKPFLLFWLGAWLIGGAMAIFMLTQMLRPARDESLRIYDDRLVHDPGSVPFNPFSWGYMTDQRQFWAEMFKARKRTEVARQNAGEIKLERVDERLRLSIDQGADRTEIGKFLREPEKEWLAGALRDWRSG